MLKFPLESPPQTGKNEQKHQTVFGVHTMSVFFHNGLKACGEPKRDMAGTHSFHILKVAQRHQWERQYCTT